MKISVTITMSKYNTKESILKLNKTDADFLHLDVMDGAFVPKMLFPYEEVKDFIKYNKKPVDVHLMVEDIRKTIKDFSNINPEYITFHAELDEDLLEIISLIHSLNIKAGISIKPSTKVSEIKKYLPLIDQVLVMSVEPGLGGQKFLNSAISKIEELKELRKLNNYNYLISVDGGINEQTSKLVTGADVISVGSFVCMHKDFQEQINKLR